MEQCAVSLSPLPPGSLVLISTSVHNLVFERILCEEASQALSLRTGERRRKRRRKESQQCKISFSPLPPRSLVPTSTALYTTGCWKGSSVKRHHRPYRQHRGKKKRKSHSSAKYPSLPYLLGVWSPLVVVQPCTQLDVKKWSSVKRHRRPYWWGGGKRKEEALQQF